MELNCPIETKPRNPGVASGARFGGDDVSVTKPVSQAWQLSGQIGQDSAVRKIPITSNPYTLGRGSGNSLCVPDPTVSTRHAELLEGPDVLFLKDVGSTNGTFINGWPLQGTAPVSAGDLLQFGGVALRLEQTAAVSSSATIASDVGDEAIALVQFGKLMREKLVTPHFQPIVHVSDRKTIGYEILARSRLFGLETPAAMFRAAAKLDSEAELSRLMRVQGLTCAGPLPESDWLYINTHPMELDTQILADSLRSLREQWPNRAIMLEIHEAAVTQPDVLRELQAVLEELDMGLAYDDFGSGQARLLEITEVRPDVLKFDMSLVRDIHRASPRRRQLVGALVRAVRDLGVIALAEGVETADELEACRDIGFELCQGYFYGRPAPVGAWIEP